MSAWRFSSSTTLLDYRADRAELGKNLGDDLAEGKATLPLIHAIAHASPDDATLLRRAVETGGLQDFERIGRIIESAGGLEYTARLARREASLAIEALAGIPDSAYRRALGALADFAVTRTH